MFGLEILDVVIGLMFVYLLLSLLATALNEYISTVLNLRGKELARGLGRLLDDLDEKDAATRALAGLEKKATTAADSLTEQFYNHRLIRPLATHALFSRKPRLPSYIPARTFAMALLDTLKVRDQDAALTRGGQSPQTAAGSPNPPAPAGDEATRARLVEVLEILKRESPQDVIERLGDLNNLLGNANLPPEVKLRLVNALTGTQTQLQKLHDSVEVWFNNAMDRVSGAYKRNVQAWLLAIGFLIAACTNADTIQMWRELAANDALAAAMAQRAAERLPHLERQVRPTRTDTSPTDTTTGGADAVPGDTPPPDTTTDTAEVPLEVEPPTPSDTTDRDTVSGDTARSDTVPGDPARQKTPADSAWESYEAAKAELDSMELKLGWTPHEAMRIGLIAPDTTYKGKVPALPAPLNLPFWAKLLGLLLTGLAISLGAPFWFDLLNRVISIRATGRAPNEKPKSPEGPPKRAAEDTPK